MVVASMLISPLMGPLLSICYGLAILSTPMGHNYIGHNYTGHSYVAMTI